MKYIYVAKTSAYDIQRNRRHVGKFRKLGGVWLFVASQIKYPLNSNELIQLALDLNTLSTTGEL